MLALEQFVQILIAEMKCIRLSVFQSSRLIQLWPRLLWIGKIPFLEHFPLPPVTYQ